MMLAAACLLAPALNHRQRDPAAEAAALGQIAAWAGQFTPARSLQPPPRRPLGGAGGLRSLPGDGAARRFGQRVLDQLDRALGLLPEARVFFTAPPRFDAALEL